MHPRFHPRKAEQHDAKEHSLKEERCHHLIRQQWPRDIADLFHETRPVGAELETFP